MTSSLSALLLSLGLLPGLVRAEEIVLVSPAVQTAVADLRGRTIQQAQARAGVDSLAVPPTQRNLRQHSTVLVGKGDFHLRATVVCDEFAGRGSAITFDGGAVVLDDREWGAVLTGRLFGGGRFPFETERPSNAVAGAPISVEIQRIGGEMAVRINEFPMGTIGIKDFVFGRIGFELAAGAMRVLDCTVEGDTSTCARPTALLSAADGDIDEYRDPSIASGGAVGLVTAVAVSTEDDGRTRTALWASAIDPQGPTGKPFRIELGDLEPDFAVLGFAAGGDRPWKLVVQALAPKHLAEQLTVFDSDDGRRFSKVCDLSSAGSPLQLAVGTMAQIAGGSTAAGATRLVDGKPRAAVVRMTPDGTWSLSDLDAEPGCEPMWLGPETALVRVPKQLSRQLARAGGRVDCVGFEGAATSSAALGGSGRSLRVVQAEPGYPYPLRELASEDDGATWRPARTIWGSSAGHAMHARVGASDLIAFEGGDRARREHILLLRIEPENRAQAPTTTGPDAQGATSAAPTKQPSNPPVRKPSDAAQ